MASDGGGEPLPRVFQLFGNRIIPGNVPFRVAPLKAMLTGNGQMDTGEDRVDIDDRPPADQCERASGGVVQAKNERLEVVREVYLRRRRSDVDEGAIDVQEIRPRFARSR